MPQRVARVTFKTVDWSGWSPDHRPIERSASLIVRDREALCWETLVPTEAPEPKLEPLDWAIWPQFIAERSVLFCYRRIAIENPGGTVNLSAPNQGRVVLQIGQSIRFATQTMDAGTHVFLGLDAIESDPPPEEK